jgi:hypothetical protein
LKRYIPFATNIPKGNSARLKQDVWVEQEFELADVIARAAATLPFASVTEARLLANPGVGRPPPVAKPHT